MALADTGMSPADLGAIIGNKDGFGGNSAWWIIILFLFAFCGGWGGNGFGNGGGVTENYVLNSDFSQLSRQLDQGVDRLATQGNQIANGLCDGFYTNAQLINGVNTNILQSANSLQAQLASCCCDNRTAISDLRYDMAQNSNAIQSAISSHEGNEEHQEGLKMDVIEIDNEIKRLEKMDATYDILNKLAVLYSIKDHHVERMNVGSRSSSEFIEAISGAPIDEALEILNEHMDAIKILHPREYTAILSRLKKIKFE